MTDVKALQQQIKELQLENSALKAENEKLKYEASPLNPASAAECITDINLEKMPSQNHLSLQEFTRYGRQMIVPGFGSLLSQIKLKKSKILVIGAGGLGCPALLYLCGAGVGKIGILDNDVVDHGNLHRQVLHTTDFVGRLKCDSAKEFLSRLNPNVNITTHPIRLGNENAFDVIAPYDLVVDCTDTPATRYLINDVCVLLGKTIVSGSGVKSDGQFTILNFANRGPCYRCFYPQAPKPETVSTCGDAGVLGPAIGITGVALATETIKVLIGYYKQFTPFLSMYCAFPDQTMRRFKMRNKQPDCSVCSEKRTISRQLIESHDVNYSAFCGAIHYDVIPASSRISVEELKQKLLDGVPPIVLDVRHEDQYKITLLPGSINIDWAWLAKCESIDHYLPSGLDKEKKELIVMCRYGNDSRFAVRKLKRLGFKNVHDVVGGINKWATEIDPTMPIY